MDAARVPGISAATNAHSVSEPVATAKAIVGNATVDNTVGAPAGFATLYPGGASLPLASNLNFVPGTIA